jgi:hypothetical protein
MMPRKRREFSLAGFAAFGQDGGGSPGGCLGADLWETEAMRYVRVYLRWLAGATLLLGAVLVNREKNGEDLMAEQA